MINLLPPKEKEELKEEKNLKLILILGIIVLAFLLSLSLILFAVAISFSTLKNEQETYLETKNKELKEAGLQELEEQIKKYNLILSQLENFYKGQPDLTLILEKIFQLLPREIYFTSLNFNPQTFQVSLSGFSPTSEDLVQFKESLEKTKGLKEVILGPPDWWLKTNNINFTVDFKIEEQK